MLKEFKEFAVRGNVMDMAVGVIIGAAFGKIVTSLVEDIIMPPIGMITNGVDFSNLFVSLSARQYPSLEAAKEAGVATLNYGLFINTLINFLIVAFAVFLLVRQINRLRRQGVETPKTPTEKSCDFCKTTIPLAAIRCPNCTSELA